jgi:NAD-dependent dihydropyrimidine dehydrogenase PreA subunit
MKEEKRETDSVKIVIDPEKCKLSGECMKVCPQGAIYVSGDKAVVDREKCDLDGICIPACPNGAIHFTNQ